MEIDEQGKKLKLWVRRKKTGLKLICSRCGQHVSAGLIHEVCEREVRDLPCFEYTTTVVVETYRVKCPRCGIRAEKVAQLPSKAPYLGFPCLQHLSFVPDFHDGALALNAFYATQQLYENPRKRC